MTWLGNGEGNTFLILTDAESRIIRASLINYASAHLEMGERAEHEATSAYDRGVARGTAKLAEEFAERNKRR